MVDVRQVQDQVYGASVAYVDAQIAIALLAAEAYTDAAIASVNQFSDEKAQDAVGSILTDTNTIDFTYNDAGGTITADLRWAPLMTRLWIGI